MKFTKVQPSPPPARFRIELDEAEALLFYEFMGALSGATVDFINRREQATFTYGDESERDIGVLAGEIYDHLRRALR